METVGIIGYGIVGKATAYAFRRKGIKVLFYDKFKRSTSLEKVAKSSGFIFVCVPTPLKKGQIDLSVIDEVLQSLSIILKHNNKVIVIKSTIVPGTTIALSKKYRKLKLCFCPEFLREKSFLQDAVNQDRIIIGSEDAETGKKAGVLFKKCFPSIPIFYTDPTSAEMVKYMANSYFGMKVIFANEIFDLCKKFGINYGNVKTMVTADKRIEDDHLDVTVDRGFGGKCLIKDLMAFKNVFKRKTANSDLLNTVLKKNLKIRKTRDWKNIPGVIS